MQLDTFNYCTPSWAALIFQNGKKKRFRKFYWTTSEATVTIGSRYWTCFQPRRAGYESTQLRIMSNVLFFGVFVKVLQVQNKKLSERLKERNYNMEQLHGEVLQLKTTQSDNQQKMLILKQFWDSIDTHIIAGLSSLGVTHEAADNEDFTKQLVTLNSTQLRLVCQDRYESSKANVVSLFKHLESQVSKLNELSSSSNLSQALEAELATWRKRNERRLTSSQPSSEILKDTNTLLKEQVTQLENNLADAKFDLHKHQTRVERLEKQLSDLLQDFHNKTTANVPVVSAQDTVTNVSTPASTTATTSVAENATMVTSNATATELPKTELVGHMLP